MSTPNTKAHQQRLVADQILDRIAGDPTFHQHLLDNTAQALQSAGFAAALETGDVAGYAAIARPCTNFTCNTQTCNATCKGFTCLVTDSCVFTIRL